MSWDAIAIVTFRFGRLPNKKVAASDRDLTRRVAI